MPKTTIDWHTATLTHETIIAADFRVTQNVRRFVHQQEPDFTFSRDFRAWIMAHIGMTMSDLIAEADNRSR
jgi:hypothetical protein